MPDVVSQKYEKKTESQVTSGLFYGVLCRYARLSIHFLDFFVTVYCAVAEFLLDAEKLVVLGHTV